jgi:hypothetical protein
VTEVNLVYIDLDLSYLQNMYCLWEDSSEELASRVEIGDRSAAQQGSIVKTNGAGVLGKISMATC